MMFKNVLLLHKNSQYETYFSDRSNIPAHIKLDKKDLARFKETHDRHFQTLQEIEELFKKHDVRYRKTSRSGRVAFENYDLVVTVGGDGTFLQAARNASSQLILGVNSDPKWSVGRLCTANHYTFPRIMKRVLSNRFRIRKLHRMQLRIAGFKKDINVMNDVLICHKNPAAMSRYHILVHGAKEEQRSSGMWISTAAGSTGAIHSAGGKVLPVTSGKIQYFARELYHDPRLKHRFKKGVVGPRQSIRLVSLMKDGVIYVDGCHLKIPFHFGERVKFSRSNNPVRVVTV